MFTRIKLPIIDTSESSHKLSKPYPAGASLAAHTQRQRNRSRCEGLPLAPKKLKKHPNLPQKGICFRQLAMPVLLASSVNALSVFCNSLKFKTLHNSFPTDWEHIPYRLGTLKRGLNLQLGNFNLLTFVFCRIFLIFAPEINKTQRV